MLRNGIKRENIDKINIEYNNNKLKVLNGVSNDNYQPKSVKELNHITHTATSDRKRAPFAMPLKNPYWDENHLWRDANLIYSYKNPDDCLRPPLSKNDKTIRFNSRFESGNLLFAYQLNPDVYHCILEYDHSSQSQCQWFYFQMSNIKTAPNSNRKTTFYISGFNKASGVFSNGSKVFMYSERLAREKNIGWFRTGTNYAYGTISTKSDENRINESRILDIEATNDTTSRKKNKNKLHKLKRSTLQFEITFPYDDDVVYLCYAQPYTYTDLNLNITNWIRSSPSLITKSVLCKTNGGKDCPLLTITAPNTPSNVTKKCIFLTARIHPGEPNGSIVLHGLIDYLLSKQPLTNFLLDHFIFKIVPMINIDGVIEGYYRVGLEGEDLNRVWNQPDPKKHPVVFQTKNLIHEMHKKHEIAAYIDFHGHSREHGTFAYGCPWEDNEDLPTTMINKEKILPKIVASLCDAFSFEKCVFSIPQKRKDASRCVVRRELNVVNSFTIESSFGGITSGIWGNSLYNEFVWKEIGAKIGESLFHLFSEPSSQTLKTAENAIATSFPIIRPVSATKKQNNANNNNNNEVQTKIEKKPEPKKKQTGSKNDNDKNKVVIAIDTQDGIRVLSTENQAQPSSSQQQKTTENGANSRLIQGNTVIQKVEQTQPIESIYTLKIADLSSYSSSSSSYASSARVKKNPRIKMNKKNNNLNSTLNTNSELKPDQISASTSLSNINVNCRSNLSQRSNAAICDTNSRLNDSKIFSSSSNMNFIPTASPISQTNEIEISRSNSALKNEEIQSTQDQNQIQNQNSILIPNSKESQNSKQIQISKANSNPNLNANENQKLSSRPQTAKVSRISKSNPVSTAANQNTNSNSESNSNTNTTTVKNSEISNKIIKPNIPSNTNSTRNSNPKLISKPNANTTTKVSIITNPNSNSNAAANSKPAPPSNAATVHNPRPNPSSNSNQNSKPNPPSNPPPNPKQNPHSSTAVKQNQQEKNSKPNTPPNTDSNQRPITPSKSTSNQRPITPSNSTANQRPITPLNTESNQRPITPSNSAVNQKPNPPQNPATTSNSKPNPHSSTSIKQNQTTSNSQAASTTQKQQNQPQNQAAIQKQPSQPSVPQQPQSQKQQNQNQSQPPQAQKQGQAASQKQNQTSNATSNQKTSQQQQTANQKQTQPPPQKTTQPQPQPPSTPTSTTAASKSNQAASNQKQNTQPQPPTSTTTAAKPKPPQSQPQKQNQTPPSTATSNSNQTQSINKSDKQKTVTNSTTKPASSPSKTNQNQTTSTNRNENQITNQDKQTIKKTSENSNKNERPNTNTNPEKQTISSTNSNFTGSTNNTQNTRINQISNLSPIKKTTENYYYDDLSSNSYLSTQSESNSLGFMPQEDNFVSDTNLMNFSTATFNSSSTYSSPTKVVKLTVQEKTQQKTQAVQQQKQKPSQNSKSPKRK